ncbi:hypothetical protein K8R78_01625 [bacterium]|nr:hypothetical protein [bacterium]
MRKLISITLLVLLLALPSFAGEGMPASHLDSSTGMVRLDDSVFADGARLLGGVHGAGAVYELTVPVWARSVALAVDWWTPRPGDGIALYVYDHSADSTDEFLGLPGEDLHWRLWGSSTDSSGLAVGSPEFLLLSRENPGGITPIDSEGTLRVLLWAEGGLPFVTDELVYLEQLRWRFSERDELWRRTPEWSSLSVPADATGFDFQRGLLIAGGSGRAGQAGSARGRLLAARAATVQALNLAVVYINEVVQRGVDSGKLPGYRILSEEELPGGSVRVEVGIPLNGAGGLAEFLGFAEITSK